MNSNKTQNETLSTEATTSESLQFVTFALGKERYGIPILQVRSVEKALPVSKVPRMPSCVEGVVNLRGELVPVIDLRAQFGLSVQSPSEYSIVISRPKNGQMIGLMVDSVSQITRVDTEDIEEMPSALVKNAKQYVTGAARTNEGMMILLDLHRILADIEEKTLQAT